MLCLLSLSGHSQPLTQLITEPDDSDTPILQQIHSANHHIDMAMYLITNRHIMRALASAHRRGVRVRLLLEPHPYQVNNIKKTKMILRAYQLPFHFQQVSRHAWLHEKAMAIDNQSLIIMTFNQTFNAYHHNRDLAIIDHNPEDIHQFETVFLHDWHHHTRSFSSPTNHTVSNLLWSPSPDTIQTLLAAIHQSKHDIFIETETFNDRRIRHALRQRAAQGVQIRILMPCCHNAPAPNQAHWETHCLNTPQIIAHAKFMLFDQQRAFVGSQNFSYNALHHNRELGIMVNTPQLVQKISAIAQKDWRRASKNNHCSVRVMQELM